MNCETGKVHISFPEGKWMYWDFKSLLAMERERWRSQVQDSRECAERTQSASIKGAKKKAKAEADKIGKDATDSRERACSGQLWSKKRSQVRGNRGINSWFIWVYIFNSKNGPRKKLRKCHFSIWGGGKALKENSGPLPPPNIKGNVKWLNLKS